MSRHSNHTSEIHAVMMREIVAPTFPVTVEPPADSPDWETPRSMEAEIASYGVTPSEQIFV